MSMTEGWGERLRATFRPRRSVFVVLGIFGLLALQGLIRVLIQFEGDTFLTTVLDGFLKAFMSVHDWLVLPLLPQSLRWNDTFALALIVVYAYLMSAVLASVAESVTTEF